MCNVISIVNQKGGVGKTTTTFNLAYSLGSFGKRVLAIDFDPQGSLTVSCGVNDNDEIEKTIARLMSKVIQDEEVINTNGHILKFEKFDLLPGNIELSAIEVGLVNTLSREHILKTIVDGLRSDYDYIIVDCSPSLGMLTINALVASDSVIIPVTPEYLSAKGLELLLKNIIKVKRILNPEIKIMGILITMFVERRNLYKSVLEMIKEAYGHSINIYESKIPKSVRVGESIYNNKSIIEYEKENKVSIAYSELAKEVLKND